MHPDTQHATRRRTVESSPGGRRGWERGLQHGQCRPRGLPVWLAGTNATSRAACGDDVRMFPLHPGLAGPLTLMLPERDQQEPALGDGDTRSSARLMQALGSPRPCLITPLGVGLHGNHLLGCSDK